MKREIMNSPVATDFPQGVPQSVVDAVQVLYIACAARKASWPLNACISCCMDASLAREMCDWPLRSLTHRHIGEYLAAAEAWQQEPEEYLYFLPRVAELISRGNADLFGYSAASALNRLGCFEHSALSDEESHAIDIWSQALWQWWLDVEGDACDRPLLMESADTLLEMFALARLPLDPFLARWQQSDSNWAAIQFGMLLADIEQHDSCTNAFAKDMPGFSETIQGWAFRSDVYLHFAKRWERMSDVDANRLLYGNPHLELSVAAVLGPRVSG